MLPQALGDTRDQRQGLCPKFIAQLYLGSKIEEQYIHREEACGGVHYFDNSALKPFMS